MAWYDSFVAFDTETTGLSSSAQIVEIGFVVFEHGAVVHECSQLLRPAGVDWDDENVKKAMEVNKLSRSELEDKPTFAEYLPDLMYELAFPVKVAHNADFDLRMIRQELSRLPSAQGAVLDADFVICTKDLSCYLNGATAVNRLNDVAARYGVEQLDAHRATVDASTCGKVLLAMLERSILPREDKAMKDLCRIANSQWKSRRR